MKPGIGIAATFLSSPALAQTTTTNCTTYYWGSTQCVSQTPQQSQGVNWGLINNNPSQNAGQSFMDGFEQGQRIRAQAEQQRILQEQALGSQQAAQAQEQAARAQEQANADRALDAQLKAGQERRAAELIKAGDCAGAAKYALEAANLTLAKQVKDYCGK